MRGVPKAYLGIYHLILYGFHYTDTYTFCQLRTVRTTNLYTNFLQNFINNLQYAQIIAILKTWNIPILQGVILLEFTLSGTKPIYQQLVDQIMLKIHIGELKAGEKLPTERDLAQQLYISRGTVKKAYKELADNNVIEIIQGSGSYVYAEKKIYDGERRKQATAARSLTATRNPLEFSNGSYPTCPMSHCLPFWSTAWLWMMIPIPF